MIRPLGDRVLIRPDEIKELTEYGIYIPESSASLTIKGEIIAVGESDKIKVKVGDRVMIPMSRLDIKEKKNHYCVVRYEQLDVVFEDE